MFVRAVHRRQQGQGDGAVGVQRKQAGDVAGEPAVGESRAGAHVGR